MYDKLNLLNLNINDKKRKILENFSQIFVEYNTKLNLISKNEIQFLFPKHIFDSLSFNLFYEKYINNDCNINLLDIGTGGGFPSIPIAIVYDNVKITAIDSTAKKINTVKKIVENLALANIEPICNRIENMDKKYKYDVVVSRAMAELRIILEYAIPYVKTGGYFVAYKSVKAEDEILRAGNALKLLNAKIVDKLDYELPISEKNRRVLLIIKKLKDTPNIYPRLNGIIGKKPL